MTSPTQAVGADGSGATELSLGPETAVGAGRGPGHIAFQGEPGAFAEDAARAFFAAPDAVAVPSWRDVFEAVTSGAADAGVVPIENLVNGTVREVYDLLLEHELVIAGEVVVPVRLCLAALPGETIESIERVYSHIQALGQADRFLRRRPWALLTTYNTAGAGKQIAERAERGAAAVLSPRAAALFGLEILAEPIQSVPENRTRFLVLGRSDAPLDPGLLRRPVGPGAPMRTTLVIALPNEPGALHRVLGVFAGSGLNMSSLESRPSHGRAWEYVFWIDLDADAASPPMRAALEELRAMVPLVRVLGSYPRAADL